MLERVSWASWVGYEFLLWSQSFPKTPVMTIRMNSRPPNTKVSTGGKSESGDVQMSLAHWRVWWLIKTQAFLRLTWTSILHVNFEPSDWSIWDGVRWGNIPACPYRCIFRRAVLWCTKGLTLLWCKQCFSTILEKFPKTRKTSLFIHPHIVKNWHVSNTWNYKKRCLAEMLKI